MRLDTNCWYHVASVFDGHELRLYVDGRLVARGNREGELKDNELPLIVGGDVGRGGSAVDALDGQLDSVRISSIARYASESFEPEARPAADDQTMLLLNFDRRVGPYVLDESPHRHFLSTEKELTLTPTGRTQ
ncbi:MAG TPA: LamG domain-containing protein [Tepidisphaeraceae bacterium]|nr:LamG domain-containing protein [Tepidisphaeraceae bacterium]